ncbi:hypothetical protein EV702DRAFT_1250415 [Suillus placidus]|uniref:Uncharacterized protein n=1 Tax=Suillus placidus TaxID=48579 RepID=A0A9P7A204_9AGAM|nr:hypothetical protein EV702DRAFT_1250415 [Suillus placidus]
MDVGRAVQYIKKQDGAGHTAKQPTQPVSIVPKTTKRGGGATQATSTVQTVLLNLTKILIEDEEVEEYNEVLIAHLHKLSEYTNQKANIYAIGKLLPTATWGQYKPINDHSKVLCDPATGEPLTIWVVGKIAKMWFAKFGVPENQASITVMPLSKTLAQQSTILLAKLSSPALPPQTTQMVRAIKWQNGKNSNVDTNAILFDAIYDARPLWNLSDLKPGDLILLEMKMIRYSKKVDDKWESRAQYEMIAISLLDMPPMPEMDETVSPIDDLAI